MIDAEAKERFDAHVAAMERQAKVLHAGEAPQRALRRAAGDRAEAARGAGRGGVRPDPACRALPRRRAWTACSRPIEASGYGLTLGVHSRIDDTVERIVERLAVGNVYVNRNMIGAVVGVQPFGGHGLSGTGPKAGGPFYLPRFATEQTVTINTAAAGGNAALIAMEE